MRNYVDTIQDPVDAFNILNDWVNSKEPVSIDCSSWFGRKVTLSSAKAHNLFSRCLGRFFECLDPELNRYKDLKDILRKVIESGKSSEELQPIFKKIKEEFIALREQSSKQGSHISSTVQANDLLEAYNIAIEKRLENIERIQVRELSSVGMSARKADTQAQEALSKVAEVSEKSVLLLEYGKIEAFVTEYEKLTKGNTPLSKEQIKTLLERHALKIADVPMGKMIDLLYRHKFYGRFALEKLITKIAIWQFGSAVKVKSLTQTVKFFRKLHADLWLDVGGQLYSFREVFGYDLREHKTKQESFTRSITDEIKKRLLEPFLTCKQEVQECLHDKTAQVICANAFSQVSLIDCAKGEIEAPKTIRGKVLSKQKPEVKEVGCQGKAEFSLHALFGEYSVDKTPANKAEAQGQLLGAMSSFINKHDTMMVVQRLAPADIHHFYATADYEILSREDCCTVLDDEFKENQKLKEALLKLFAGDKNATINIAGSSCSSVSTNALRQESSILATNDRKIMMVRHKDGSIAFHVFIGATAVNSIDVTVPAGEQVAAGHDCGAMKYSSEHKEEWITAKTGEEAKIPFRDWVIIWPFKMVQSVVRWLGSRIQWSDRGIHVHKEGTGFEQGGSTVVSLYLKRDYWPIPLIADVTQKAVRAVSGTQETIEIQCQLGNTLATPVAYQVLQCMRDNGIEINPQNPDATLLKFKETLASKENTPFEKEWERILTAHLQGNVLDEDDTYMLKKVKKAIRRHSNQE